MFRYVLPFLIFSSASAFAAEEQDIIKGGDAFLMPSGDIVCFHGLDSGFSLGCGRYNEQTLFVSFQNEEVNVTTEPPPRATFGEAKYFAVGKTKNYADMICTSKKTGLECIGELVRIELSSKTFLVTPVKK
jgi:hypothetical protein